MHKKILVCPTKRTAKSVFCSEATDAVVIGIGQYVLSKQGTSPDRFNLLGMVGEEHISLRGENSETLLVFFLRSRWRAKSSSARMART